MGEKRKSSPLILFAGLLLLVGIFYFFFGFFVVQPIGAAPKGVTIFYLRLGSTNISFIESPDSLSQKIQGGVSIFGRGMAITSFMKVYEHKIILRLPYTKFLYLISTGGKEYH